MSKLNIFAISIIVLGLYISLITISIGISTIFVTSFIDTSIFFTGLEIYIFIILIIPSILFVCSFSKWNSKKMPLFNLISILISIFSVINNIYSIGGLIFLFYYDFYITYDIINSHRSVINIFVFILLFSIANYLFLKKIKQFRKHIRELEN